MSSFKEYLAIRKMYARILPEWMAEYEATGIMQHDPYIHDWQFSPIENHVWNDIRTIGMPFYPQIPVLNYFIDFGCPFMKIGIECDGKEWHDSAKDKDRDAELVGEGWMIFRIEGHKCCRYIEPWQEGEDHDEELIEKYFHETSEGILSAIKHRYFEDYNGAYGDFIASTLHKHRSTPENFWQRPATIKRNSNPVLFSDALEEYRKNMLRRIEKRGFD